MPNEKELNKVLELTRSLLPAGNVRLRLSLEVEPEPDCDRPGVDSKEITALTASAGELANQLSGLLGLKPVPRELVAAYPGSDVPTHIGVANTAIDARDLASQLARKTGAHGAIQVTVDAYPGADDQPQR